MRYIIYGAGGVGSVIGGLLFEHGHEVVLICRGAHLDAVRAHGLTLKTPQQSLSLPIEAVGHPDQMEFRDDDVVFMAMKSQDSVGALTDLRRATDGVEPSIICAQNGVENERSARRQFERVYGMTTRLPATFLDAGIVLDHAVPVSGVIDAGRYPRGVDPLIEQVTKDLGASGFCSRAEPEIMRWKYAKLLRNLNNGLGAICGGRVQAPEFVQAMRDEATACYQAAGIDWASDEEEQGRRDECAYHLEPIDGDTRGGNSSWQGLVRGRDTIEADYLNGEIVLLGIEHGVPTPHNRAVQEAANRIARNRGEPGALAIADLEVRVRELQGSAAS